MDDSAKRALLEEIAQLSSPPPPVEADEFTCNEFWAALRKAQPSATRAVAERRLNTMVGRGLLTRRLASRDGRTCWAYRRAER